ncbi:hypothetical protein NCQ_01209 [Burkholderia pseudomallei]
MSLIVAARFTTQRAAEAATQRLLDSGFVAEDVSLFFVNPRGQHAPRWSERLPRAQHAATHSLDAMQHARHGTTIGAVAGAIFGVALFSLVTPSLVVALCAAGVGAFLGGWIGGMMHKEDFTRTHVRELAHDAIHHETRASGMLVAVHVTADSQADAARARRSRRRRHRARDGALAIGPLGRLRSDPRAPAVRRRAAAGAAPRVSGGRHRAKARRVTAAIGKEVRHASETGWKRRRRADAISAGAVSRRHPRNTSSRATADDHTAAAASTTSSTKRQRSSTLARGSSISR